MNMQIQQQLTQAIGLLYNASRRAAMTADDHELCERAAREALSLIQSLTQEESHDDKPA